MWEKSVVVISQNVTSQRLKCGKRRESGSGHEVALSVEGKGMVRVWGLLHLSSMTPPAPQKLTRQTAPLAAALQSMTVTCLHQMDLELWELVHNFQHEFLDDWHPSVGMSGVEWEQWWSLAMVQKVSSSTVPGSC